MDKPSPKQHYTQLAAQLRTAVDLHHGGLYVSTIRGEGILTPALLESTLGQWDGGQAPRCLLVDLRDVAGYEAGSLEAANAWLGQARARGVRKIALLASSTVLNTAAKVASQRSGVALRTFGDERNARSWLVGAEADGVPVTVPPAASEPLPVRL